MRVTREMPILFRMSALPKHYGLNAYPEVDEELIAAPPPWVRPVAARPSHPATKSPAPATGSAADGDSVRLDMSVLETKHPAIAKAVVVLWGSREMNEYLTQLCLGDGIEPIDPDAMSDLMLLSRIHHSVVPNHPNPHSMAARYDGSVALHAPRTATGHSAIGPRRTTPVPALHRR